MSKALPACLDVTLTLRRDLIWSGATQSSVLHHPSSSERASKWPTISLAELRAGSQVGALL